MKSDYSILDDESEIIGWDLFYGCEKISRGCLNCIAEQRCGSLDFKINRDALREPPLWKNCRSIVIRICQNSDFFQDKIFKHQASVYDYVFRVFLDNPRHRFSILTKRVENMKWVVDHVWGGVPGNVILGTSVEDQKTVNERIPVLLQIDAGCRIISAAPMLEPIDLKLPVGEISCVSCSGELGPGARPFKDEWARDLLEQCKTAGADFSHCGVRGKSRDEFVVANEETETSVLICHTERGEDRKRLYKEMAANLRKKYFLDSDR